MKATTPKMYRSEDAALFDTGEMQHVCSLIKESYDRPEGERAALAKSLTKLWVRCGSKKQHPQRRLICAEQTSR